jgi:hypothetical protein
MRTFWKIRPSLFTSLPILSPIAVLVNMHNILRHTIDEFIGIILKKKAEELLKVIITIMRVDHGC